jgi:hypothetical protein
MLVVSAGDCHNNNKAAATTSSSSSAAAAPPFVSNCACKNQEITLLTNFYILKDFAFRRLSGLFITPMNNMGPTQC